MSAGKAVVTTPVGCEGIEAEDGRHLLVADDAPAFAEHVLALLRSPDRRHSIGKQSRRLVVEKYDWETLSVKLHRIYTDFVFERSC